MRPTSVSAAFAIGFSLLASNGMAATFKVTNTADSRDHTPGDGKCSTIAVPPPNSNVCTLRAAIMEANTTAAHDSIVLADGATYLLTQPGRDEDNALDGDLDIRQPVTISTPLLFGLPTGTATIDANGIDRVFDIGHVLAGSGVKLLGLTLRNGDPGATTTGAGIRLNASKAAFQFLNISALNGQGIETIGDVSDVAIEYSTVSGSSNAIAVEVIRGRAAINSSALVRSGTGLVAQQVGTQVHVSNTTISGNVIGAAVIFGASATVADSTVADNSNVGLTYNANSGTISVSRTVFASNGSSCPSDGNPAMENNLYDDDSCPVGGIDDHSQFDTPAFLSLLDNHGGPAPTHRPMVASSAIDQVDVGSGCSDADYDQRLMPRAVAFTGGEKKCDIGAVELETDVIFFDQVDRL